MELSLFIFCIWILCTAMAAVLNVPDTVSETTSGKVYTLHTVKQTWMDARRVCRHGNGYLVNLGTDDKYMKFTDLKNGVFKDQIEKPWVGLYFSSSTTRHWDGSGCPPAPVTGADGYKWRSDDDSFASKYCYREHGGFEDRDCSEKNTFICESPSAAGCTYISSVITSFNISSTTGVGSAAGLDECKSYCDSTNGCFLVGARGVHCIGLMAGEVSSNPVALKQCPIENKIETTEVLAIDDEDTGNPTDCFSQASSVYTSSSVASSPSSSSVLSATCSTVTSTTVETETVSETTTDTTTETTTESFTETTTDTMTETTTESFTETTTDTTTETTTESYTETTTDTTTETTTLSFTETSTETETVTETGSDALQVTTVTQTSYDRASVYLTVSVPCLVDSSRLIPSLAPTSVLSVSTPAVAAILGEDGVLRSWVCRDVIVVTPDPAMTSEVVKSIVDDLIVDKSNISAVVQKKISARDERQSSTAIGYAGIVFLIVPLLLIIIVDVPICIDGGKNLVRLLKT